MWILSLWYVELSSFSLAQYQRRHVTIPTCIVWGREDRLVPWDCAGLFQKAIPGSDLVVIENCGHVPKGRSLTNS